MNWINGFELLCYALTVFFLYDLLKRRDGAELRLFLSAALAGYVLELLAVRVTGIYHYSDLFCISIGFRPYQFPFFGGLMWGGLTVCALRTVRRLKMNAWQTAAAAGWLIVTMDILLDVAAIRLDGGFWVWEGRPITLDITHHMFMSVIWVNFLGYLFETPAVVYLHLRTEHRPVSGIMEGIRRIIITALTGIGFVGAASGISLCLNQWSDEWFACAAFLLLWIWVLLLMIKAVLRIRLCGFDRSGIPALLYWAGMYLYCLCALVHLGIAQRYPLYFLFGAVCMILTCTAAVLKTKEKN